ncbi:Uridine phosphorylase [Desulfocicer vacuolatum DSM 3385]|uniref:Uridine phosphorylase n=1 Tax=Desulfocicer vacuolatum DSM 3385 TaxID=1121400 RepID=A0A1W2BGE2_9BACT|nr:Uridine phosphorylase [Desulfocicer vacuolatum DSM 3385]
MSLPTLSDLNSPSLVPPLGARSAPDIGPLAVMISTEPDVRYIKKNLGRPRSRSFFMGELFPIRAADTKAYPGQEKHKETPDTGKSPSMEINEKGTLKNKIKANAVDKQAAVFAGPYIGAPYAVMLLESLIARGAKQIIVIGWCGSISSDIQIGDILMPHAAIAHEGTSQNYMACTERCPEIPLPASPSNATGLTEKLTEYLDENHIPFKTGTIWTTDAIYRETAEKVSFFRARGALAVEMECSALFAVAAHRKVELVPLLVVSDELSKTQWKPAFKSKVFGAARKQVSNAVIDFCNRHCRTLS